jgi:dTDP-4-dehydrorhamnose reductase
MSSVKKTILVAGASGLLGSRVCTFYKKQGFQVIVTYRKNQPRIYDSKYKIDLIEKNDLSKIKDSVSLVINCAGYTNIESNELFPEKSWLENVVIPYNLSEFSKLRGAKFLHISTDHFVSLKNTPRIESEKFIAINKYGYSKLEAEKIIINSNPEALIVRTNFFGKGISGSASLLDWVLKQIEYDDEIMGFEDVLFNPVSIEYLVQSIETLLAKNLNGIYNVASTEVLSKFDFIKLVYNVLNKNSKKIVKVSIDSDPNLTIRPKYMALDSSKFELVASQNIPSIYDMLRSELMVL